MSSEVRREWSPYSNGRGGGRIIWVVSSVVLAIVAVAAEGRLHRSFVNALTATVVVVSIILMFYHGLSYAVALVEWDWYLEERVKMRPWDWVPRDNYLRNLRNHHFFAAFLSVAAYILATFRGAIARVFNKTLNL